MGLTFHVALSVLGLAIVLKSNPLIFNILRYAGAFYLVYIGFRCFTDAGVVDFDNAESQIVAGSFGQGFREGLFCNLLNPKVTLFILSIFMQVVSPEAPLYEKMVYGSVIISEALIGWILFVIFLNTSFMQKIYGKHAGVVNKVTGVILFVLGGAIFIS